MPDHDMNKFTFSPESEISLPDCCAVCGAMANNKIKYKGVTVWEKRVTGGAFGSSVKIKRKSKVFRVAFCYTHYVAQLSMRAIPDCLFLLVQIALFYHSFMHALNYPGIPDPLLRRMVFLSVISCIVYYNVRNKLRNKMGQVRVEDTLKKLHLVAPSMIFQQQCRELSNNEVNNEVSAGTDQPDWYTGHL